MKILKPLLATTFVAKMIQAVGKKNHPVSVLVTRNVKLNRRISRKRASTFASINAWLVSALNQII
jgi:hypothetical protein